MDKKQKKIKIRIDQALVDRGLVESRSKAQALIMAGMVLVGERRIDKPGQTIEADAPITLKGQDHPWVSRGGLKLAHGLAHFALDPSGWVAMDIGASTGGFTDVLLTHGAAHVFAVDVGRGQLHWKLQTDPRVTVLDETNARYLAPEQINQPVDLVTCDASFINLEKLLPASLAILRPGGYLIALIKPQFEVGRQDLGKGGVVRDPAAQMRVCAQIQQWLEQDYGWQVLGITESPITGPQGNHEFLIAARKPNLAASDNLTAPE